MVSRLVRPLVSCLPPSIVCPLAFGLWWLFQARYLLACVTASAPPAAALAFLMVAGWFAGFATRKSHFCHVHCASS